MAIGSIILAGLKAGARIVGGHAVASAALTFAGAIGKKVVGFCKNIFNNRINNAVENKLKKENIQQTAKEVADMGAFDKQTASQEQILNFDKSLDNIREEYYQKLYKIETSTINDSRAILNEITKIIENEFKPKGIEINIDSIKYKFENSINLFKNSFSIGVIRHIALSDNEMERILKIRDYNKRQKDINNYINKFVKEATEEYCSNLDNITNESLKIIGDTVNDYLNNTESGIKTITEEIENNEKLNIKEIETKRKEYENKAKLLEEFLNILD